MDRGHVETLGEVGTKSPESSVRPGRRRRLPSVKVLLFGFVLMSLLGILALAAVREVATSPANARAARPTLAPPRPPLTAAEEDYALALWPIHNEVKVSALKMTLGGLAYKLGDVDRSELGARVQGSAETYRRAAKQIAALTPPASLAQAHATYVEAVRLYQKSAAEMMLVLTDGRDEHLVAAQPLSMEASEKLLKVGDVLWPNEYKPN